MENPIELKLRGNVWEQLFEMIPLYKMFALMLQKPAVGPKMLSW